MHIQKATRSEAPEAYLTSGIEDHQEVADHDNTGGANYHGGWTRK